MRKLITAAAVVAAALGVAATAQAGPEASDSSGNTVVLDADFSPPATGKSVKVTTASFDVSFANKRNGQPFPQTQRLVLGLPSGSKYNGLKFPQCVEKQDGTLDCPKDAQVGDGEAVIDARALGVQDPVKATVKAYNGPTRQKKHPTLILLADGSVNGQRLSAEIDFAWTGKGFELFLPPGTNRIAYSFSSFQLNLGAYFKSKTSGHKAVTTSLLQAPKSCSSRGWAFSLLHGDSAGNMIKATDRQPCLRVR